MNQNLKTDVFVSRGDELLQSMANLIKKQYGTDYIRSGQKRIVYTENSNSNVVYKMPYNMFGIVDNAIEVLFWKVLCTLRDHGKINNYDLELFTRTEIVNNDLFKISCERAEYIGNVLQPGKSVAASVLANYDYMSDYKRIQQILSRYFVAYDTTIFREPMNFGFINRGSRKRLVLIDAGSIIPKINLITGVDAKVTCPNCGGEMVYRFDDIEFNNNNYTIASSQKDGGIYTCRTNGCINNVDTSERTKANVDSIDLYVYNTYMKENKKVVDAILAAHAGLFIPNTNGMSYDNYRNMFLRAVSSVKETANEVKCLLAYALYIDHVGASRLASDDDLVGELIEFKRLVTDGNYVSYGKFRSVIDKFNLQPLLSAWIYISVYLGLKDNTDEPWARYIVINGDYNSAGNRLKAAMSRTNIQSNDNDIKLLLDDLVI